jgi:hypothetical protein
MTAFGEATTVAQATGLGRMQNVPFEGIGYLPFPTLSGPSATV